MVGAVFAVSGQDSYPIIMYEGHGISFTIHVMDVILLVLALAFFVFVWAQHRREALENYLREMLRRRYKE